ncbi:MAG: hypothetical protein GX119_03640 [Syntrophomonadaceae bacterium]|jgi:chromosome segregation ATPase|nr:hypothetical protein [Syntrophomonadaceae bacterium]
MNKNLTAENYSRSMEQFLLLLRGEVDSLSRQYQSDTLSLEDLDHYLLAVNSFYYRSFQEKFWPGYQKEISEQVNDLLNLKLQESQLSKYIAAVIKRHAHLFNQVKALSNELRGLKQEISDHILSLQDEIDRQVLELIYSLKELGNRLRELDSFMQELNELLKELQSWPSSQYSQFMVMAARSLDNSKDMNYSNRYYQMLKQQQQIRGLLDKSQQDDSLLLERIQRLRKQLLDCFPTDGGPLDRFYQVQVQSRALHFTELIILHIQLENSTRVQELLQEFADFFAAWVKMLDLLLTHGRNPALIQLPELYELNLSQPGYMEELYYDLASAFASMDSLEQEIDKSPQADFNYLSQQLQNLLQLSAPLYLAMAQESSCHQMDQLTGRLQGINGSWEVLDSRMRIIAEEYGHSAELIKYDEKLISFLDGQLELLDNIQHDLERLLAPRNLTRIWKDFDIRVTHIPLTPGEVLPPPYLYLLDKYHILARITEEADNTILEAQGDIFLIRVEDESCEEIPYFIVGQKG